MASTSPELAQRVAREGARAPERPLERLAHGALRGAMGAMAITGFREFTRHVGILEETPPETIVRQRLLRGLVVSEPRRSRRG